MELPFKMRDDGTIYLVANPDYYDYIHHIKLMPKYHTFEMVDGGSQSVNAIFGGTYKCIDDKTIEFHFTKNIDWMNEDNVRHMDCIKRITFKIIDGIRHHFNGYSKSETRRRIVISNSPFYPESSDVGKLPLVFYDDVTHIDCDIMYERLLRDEPRAKRMYMKYIDSSDESIKQPNSEEIRKLNLTDALEYWVIVKFTDNNNFILYGSWSNMPLFITKKDGIMEYHSYDYDMKKYKSHTDQNDEVIKFAPKYIIPSDAFLKI